VTDSRGLPEPGNPQRPADADPGTSLDSAKLENDLRAINRIVLRPIGSPLPLGVSKAGAALGFLLAAVARYTAFALLLEDARGREVPPIGRLGAAREAVGGTLADELPDIERAPGVRRTL
jgi:hypothetical protein